MHNYMRYCLQRKQDIIQHQRGNLKDIPTGLYDSCYLLVEQTQATVCCHCHHSTLSQKQLLGGSSHLFVIEG